ncbi:MG2 domain-containing protein [Pontibacter mucosus]|uniref:MG2 domain-containing protein n=2 Tax=Pontibacter mucosus TaxID=1649266 RepID=A0A2T5YP27_9BACT|nr:MG2 domain-containing protein [Pontibacter mucosus]
MNLRQKSREHRHPTSMPFYLPAILALILCLSVCGKVAAQAGGITSITQDFDAHRRKAPQEKLFLHLDRPVYACGETMWFKVYSVDGTLHQPLDLSKVAYVEVLDTAHRPVLQAKVALNNGTGNGSFILPASLSSGNYTVRAYTNWMKNAGPDFFFEQPVTIVNTFRQLEAPGATQAPGYAVQFFPEGGHLVAGIAGKVAFKAVDKVSGKGVAFTGELQDQSGGVIATFAPHKFGMGHFTFTPEKEEKYTAVISLADGKMIRQALPAVQDRGYAMQLKEAGAGRLKISVSQAGVQGARVYLLGHTRQQVAIAEEALVNEGKAIFLIEEEKLADGITHFTIFTPERQPVCERLYFKRPTQALQLELTANKSTYGTRDKVALDLVAQTAAGTGTRANLSMAVYRLDSLQQSISGDIESYLWLTSDLKGSVENPGYYFSGAGATDRQAMDNLMLTHGWSRFKWESMIGKQPAPLQYLPEYNGHLIQGKVTHRATGAPAPGIATYLSSPGKHIRLYNTISGTDGRVTFEAVNFFGERDIVVQSDFTKDSTYHFEIFSPFSDKYSTRKLPALNLTEQLAQELTLRHVQTQVQHAFVGSRANGIVTASPDTTTFYGTPDERYFLDDYKRFRVMEEVMREYVPGVMVRRQGGKFRFMVMNRPYRTVFQNNPMVLLDGVPVFDIDRIMAFDPLQVQRLDVVTSRFLNRGQVHEGVVSYTTYKGDLGGFELHSKALLQAYEGLQLQREFYAPTYETPEQKQSRLADLRNLLHWAPALVLETGQQQQTHFYTSDQTGTYLVVVQGLTEDGHIGSKVLTLKVHQPLVRK